MEKMSSRGFQESLFAGKDTLLRSVGNFVEVDFGDFSIDIALVSDFNFHVSFCVARMAGKIVWSRWPIPGRLADT